ncbi:zf-DHHC-domain-containing protein [Cystobasidium minutum MCA 4210]|uniref:zf-DHHC-domain-containing protein n=1 Tax=Cystobasidium minutum MCA 4210 TaxID=1397322 RepID=UPI0034CE8FC8|eukprot:jgi/Rhomi1/166429/fgenesh1_kg.1_\
MLERISRSVFSCFHRFERAVTRFTDSVGPACVFVCSVLLALGTVTFFDVFYYDMFLKSDKSWFTSIFGSLWAFYLIVNVGFQYYSAVTILPGSPSDPPGTMRTRPFLSWKNRRAQARPSKVGIPDHDLKKKRRDRLLDASATSRTCKRCPLMQDSNGNHSYKQSPKPERSHHCSVCGMCWLAFDHHCPWINGCVGLYNARYFLLFMVHMALACTSVALLGFNTMLRTFDFRSSWPYLTPRPFSLILWILCVAMGFALSVMSLWQLWLVAQNETSVEANDNSYYRKIAKRRNKTFIPPYNLGWRENFAEFFNVGEDRYSWWTVLLPLRIEPANDGWRWRKRHDWQAGRMEEDDLLTDEEDG